MGKGGGKKGGGKGGKKGGKAGGKKGGKGGKKGGKGGKKGAKKVGAGAQVVVEAHLRHEGVYVSKKGQEQSLLTLNMVPGVSVYGEKRLASGTDEDKKEYRVWSPFRSKLAAAIVGGVDNLHIKPGSKVLYLGAASGTTVSHVSDLVGPTGWVYAVEFSPRSGRELVEMVKKRPNVVPIVEDARFPNKYRMLVPMVDVIFSDVAQPNATEIIELNAKHFLRNEGHFILTIKANCIDSTAPAAAVVAGEIEKMQKLKLRPQEQLTLEPFERDHAVVVGVYRQNKKKKKE